MPTLTAAARTQRRKLTDVAHAVLQAHVNLSGGYLVPLAPHKRATAFIAIVPSSLCPCL